MDVLRVFNNNVVLAKDDNSEVILTGRGIGFQAKPGQHVDDAKIVRRFVPADGKDPDHMAQQVAGIPPEIIRLVTDAMNRTGLKEQADRQPALVLALSDHICGAIRRSQNKQTIEYPLEAEVRSLYASEYAKGKALVDAMNTYLGGALPDCEAVALALHLVNAGFYRRSFRHIHHDRRHPANADGHRRLLRHPSRPEQRQCGAFHHASALSFRAHPPT